MASTRRLMALVLAVAVLATTALVIPSFGALGQNETDSPDSFAVAQGEQCVTVQPIGNGTRSVESFYDYRIPPNGDFVSYGTFDLQRNEVSQLFVYNGSDGLSLVFLHDRLGERSSFGGGVITADITGLPTEGQWVIMDDKYAAIDLYITDSQLFEVQEDVFENERGATHIEWVWKDNRSDGAVFRGLGSDQYDEITVDMQFNNRSNRYPYDEWSGPPERHRIEDWIVRSAANRTHTLDMDRPVTIGPGGCSPNSSGQ
jgi:hypothetical protein